MKTKLPNLLKATAIGIALLGSTAIVGSVAFPDVAYAKEGNGNGNGNGGGNKGGNSGKGGGSGADKSKAPKHVGNSNRKKSASGAKQASGSKRDFSLKKLLGLEKPKPAKLTRTVKEKVKPEERPKGNKMAELLGVHPSELGALNAANANENALKNAAPNSRVGLISTYKETVLAGDELRQELLDKQSLLDEMSPPERSVTEIEGDLEVALDDVQDKQDRVDDLEEALEQAGGSDPDIQAELDQANSDLQASTEAAEALEAERQAAVEYDQTVAEVEELSEQVDDQALTEREALEAAANKPVTDEVEAAVKTLLGL